MKREQINNFKTNITNLFNNLILKENEEHLKNVLSEFLKETYYKNSYKINTSGNKDLVIKSGNKETDKIEVIFEVKHPDNNHEMINLKNPNKKALHQLLLHFLNERYFESNTEIKFLVVTNIYEWFIFDSTDFERFFFENNKYIDQFIKWSNNKLGLNNTDWFYNEFVKPIFENEFNNINCTHFDLRDYQKYLNINQDQTNNNDLSLLELYKILSPEHLLKKSFANDSNSLNKEFYNELLYIIGLEEIKDGSKKIIRRCEIKSRNAGTLIENTINIIKTNNILPVLTPETNTQNEKEDYFFNIALELCLTWLNRILFLKLLEGQLFNYNKEITIKKFINIDIINDFDDLNELFFEVISVPISKRTKEVAEKFGNIPYLNSSLFEKNEIETNTILISNLKSRLEIPLYNQTVLKDNKGKRKKGNKNTLEYLFEFLDAFNFSSDSKAEIQEENKTIINASVLGLIFEKINGYKDGSFFTPGLITMYMCRETIRKAVVQKFNERYNWEVKNFIELHNKIEKISKNEASEVINALKICDPAVGSGHFLVSALNEIISIKNDLELFIDKQDKILKGLNIHIENDELIITHYKEPFLYNYKDQSNQIIQETLFNEKQKIIENCLFGVDINPKSVMICRLRLWIELLKSSYYTEKSKYNELETLPNIDINIKCGNSLVYRFDVKDNYLNLPSFSQQKIKLNTSKYKEQVIIYKSTTDSQTKRNCEKRIKELKETFYSASHPNDEDYKKWKEIETKLGEIPIHYSTEEKNEWLKESEKLAKQSIELQNKYGQKLKELYGNAFEWRFEYPEVLDENGNFSGFDVVLANPPYITGKSDSFNKLAKDFFNKNYTTAEYQLDTYILFIELVSKLQKENKYFSLIIPNTWLSNLKLTKVRKFLLENFTIHNIIEMSSGTFEDANVDTVIIMVEKRKCKSNEIEIGIFRGNKYVFKRKISQVIFEKNEKFIFDIGIDFKNRKIINKIEEVSIKLEEISSINRGICAYRTDGYGISKYGKGVQTQKDYDKRSYHSKNKEDKTYYQEVRGKNIFPYKISEPEEYVSWGKWLAEPREWEYFSGERIYLRKIVGKTLYASYTDDENVADQSVYISKITNKKYSTKLILAILNSRIMAWYFKVRSNEFDAIFPQIKIKEFKQLPIPKDIDNNKKTKIESLVEKIIKLKEREEDTSKYEEEINEMVSGIYELNAMERVIIEEL